MLQIDAVGYVASILVLTTFSMRSMVSLRVIGLCSNFAFILYGAKLGLAPVLLLHVALVPINTCRLWQSLMGQACEVAAQT